MRILFMGTSEFAVPTLNGLHDSCHKLVAVVTQPDRPKGRGRKIAESPVKKAAFDLGYKVMQPTTVNGKEFIFEVELLAPDLFVVLAFGQILNKQLIRIPKMGVVNVHPSLIPKYRGAAPIQWAIINGDKETGVTTMLMDAGMDTGCVLMKKRVGINSCDTSVCLQNRLSWVGSELLLQTIEKLGDGSLTPVPQKCTHASLAPQLKKKDGEINWNVSAVKIESFVRGMNPWPGAFTFINGKRLKIISAVVVKFNFNELPGTVLDSYSGELRIATAENVLSIQEIQLDSGKKTKVAAFLRGFSFPQGSILG